jgi:methylglutaconyl-CoA hydratase
MKYRFLDVRRDGAAEYLTLNRPEVRNAFNDELVAELTDWSRRTLDAAERHEVRAAVVAGAGKVFCAGADATWMARTVGYSADENRRDAEAMARMLGAFDALPIAVIARVHGAALGGGAGLAAVCDIVVADEAAVFGFPEVKLGLVPATVGPFVLARIGPSAARELFLTGMRVSAARAREIGLVHAVAPAAALDTTIAGYLSEVLSAGPEAVATAKALVRQMWGRHTGDASAATAAIIADRRVSPEGQEGLRAFLEKRKPAWTERPAAAADTGDARDTKP